LTQSRPRILVTEVQERAGLGAVRALAAAGFVVGGAASSSPAQGHWSRYCRERFTLPDPRADIDLYAEALERVLDRGFDVVLPGTDASLFAISEHRGRLDGITRLGLPSKEVVRKALDKVSLLTIAAESGLAPPTSAVCAAPDDVRRAIVDLEPPVLVKPHATCVPVGRTLRSQRGVVIHDESDIRRALDVLIGPYVVQRYVVDGWIVSCAGVVADGRLLALAAARYVRTWPPDVGAASFAESVGLPDDVLERVERLVVASGWQGPFELELMSDGHDVHAIDLNPRLHGWLALATCAGANLPAVWARWVLGSTLPFVIGRPGVHYRWEDGEFMNVMRHLSRGRLGDAIACLGPNRDTTWAMTMVRDPLPLVARVAWVARRLPGWIVSQERARQAVR
jgi:predicted ATP-grasp superfamily ATP-dependent carboligase